MIDLYWKEYKLKKKWGELVLDEKEFESNYEL